MATSSQVIYCRHDSWVDSVRPSANNARDSRLGVQSGSPGAFAFVYFDIPFRRGMTIMSATLRMYTVGSWGITPTLTAKRADSAWKHGQIDWNNDPGVVGVAATVSHSSAADGDEFAFDLAAILQAVSNGARWYGLRIETNNANRKYLRSAQAASKTPVLEVTWSDAPQAPSDLSPAGSRKVSIAKPVLRFHFVDLRGSTALQAVQVQIDAAGNFATPGFDSGTVATTEEQLDLTATAYGGLTAGTSTQWRARCQDGSGLWSPWSDPVTFGRDNKGTLTISNPALATPFVDEWTPPIIWALAGETQTAWRVQILAGDDPTVELYDSGRTKGTATSKTLPRVNQQGDAILEDGSTYVVRVRVWDSKDREATPGDPPWTVLERTFTFREDATVTPVNTLTATVVSPTPWTDLGFVRATAPDYFVVKRDGKVIATNLLPGDLFVSGTTYKYTDREAAPWRSHTWVVQAAVGGKTSASNPSVSKITKTEGLWIYDPDRNIQVLITDVDFGSWPQLEIADTFLPLNSSRPVRIIQAMGGYQVPLMTGTLAPIPEIGVTMAQQEDNFYSLKERPNREVVIVAPKLGIRALLMNMTTTPTDDPDDSVVKCELGFQQVGRLRFKARF